MSSIPPWLLLIIRLAIQIGSPYLLQLIQKYIGKLPEEVKALINELIGSLLDPKVDNRTAKRAAVVKLKKCKGVACPPKPVE